MNLFVEWSDEDLVAQAVIFLLAGFDTVSNAMSFAMHELAMNPDVQDKLVAEIREHKEKNGGKFDFSSIQNMVYMDMVVSGEIRFITKRTCTYYIINISYTPSTNK
jgi:cytochrome P450 family 9